METSITTRCRGGEKEVVILGDRAFCGCVEVRSVTASLSLVGYGEFKCGENDLVDSSKRYLRYRISGPANIQACGGWSSKTEDATQIFQVDPMTGITCRTGSARNSIFYLCTDSGETTCSATSRRVDCGEFTPEELEEYCISEPAEGEEPKRKHYTETLSVPYTINDVAANVDLMLGRVNPYSRSFGMPAGVSGSVINGTGHSVLTWSNARASTVASHSRSSDSVSKTRLFVRFLKNTRYRIDGTEFNGTAGQMIVIDPPSEPNTQKRLFVSFCGAAPSSLDIDYGGSKNDATLKANTCVPFIAPNCKEYNTKTTTSNRTYSWSNSGSSGGVSYSGAYNLTSNFTTVDTACPSSSTTNGSSTISGQFTDDLIGGSSFSCTETVTNNETTYEGDCPAPSENPIAECSADCSTTESSSSQETDPLLGRTTQTSTSRSKSVNIGEAIVSVNGNYSRTFTFTETGPPSGNGTTQESDTCAYYLVFSNDAIPEDENSEGGDKWDWNTDTNYSGCASHTDGWNFRSKSTVSMGLTGTFNASRAGVYEYWFHHIRRQNNFRDEDCPILTLTAHNEIYELGSSEGTSRVSSSIFIGTPISGNTICAENVTFHAAPMAGGNCI